MSILAIDKAELLIWNKVEKRVVVGVLLRNHI